MISQGFKQIRLNSNPHSGGKLWLNEVSRSAVKHQLYVAWFNVLKNGRGGATRQRPGASHRHDGGSRRRWGGREECVQILQDFRRRSGLLTLAFAANCYSFTLPLFPRTLDLQSLHGKRAQKISQQVCTSTSRSTCDPATSQGHRRNISWFGKLHDWR